MNPKRNTESHEGLWIGIQTKWCSFLVVSISSVSLVSLFLVCNGIHVTLMPEGKKHNNSVESGVINLLINLNNTEKKRKCPTDVKIAILGDSTAARTYLHFNSLLKCKLIETDRTKNNHLPNLKYYNLNGKF